MKKFAELFMCKDYKRGRRESREKNNGSLYIASNGVFGI